MSESQQDRTFTTQLLSPHTTADAGLYLAIDGQVYDVTGFIDEHPGGAKILRRATGKDASKQFWKYHNESVLKKYGPKLRIGKMQETEKAKL